MVVSHDPRVSLARRAHVVEQDVRIDFEMAGRIGSDVGCGQETGHSLAFADQKPAALRGISLRRGRAYGGGVFRSKNDPRDHG